MILATLLVVLSVINADCLSIRSEEHSNNWNFSNGFKSNEVLMNLNPEVDPCDDFYEFACGNFKNNHPRGDSHSSSYFELQGKHVEERVEELLNQKVHPSSESGPEAYVRKMYKMCMSDESDDIDELRKVMFNIFVDPNMEKRR